MKKLKWGLIAAASAVIVLFLLYFMPSYDVVRIVGTEVARTDASAGEAPSIGVVRDVRYIKAAASDGEAIIYRNEDTGWGWPPYFKFDSADLAARADALATEALAGADGPLTWSVVTHYGWRIEMLDMFPNAVNIRPATGPDERVIPWANILIFALLAFLAWQAARLVRRARATAAGQDAPTA